MTHPDDVRDRIRLQAMGLLRSVLPRPDDTRLPPATGTTLLAVRPSRWRRFLVWFGLASALAGCQVADVASCGDDPACLVGALDPEQVRGALEFAGPCWAFADRFCARVEFCTGALSSVAECREWVLENVCSVPDYKPEDMRTCAAWSDAVACEWFDDPDFYPHAQTCAAGLPRPIASDAFAEDVPASLR